MYKPTSTILNHGYLGKIIKFSLVNARTAYTFQKDGKDYSVIYDPDDGSVSLYTEHLGHSNYMKYETVADLAMRNKTMYILLRFLSMEEEL